ncbi:MAG: CoA ester lyase [Proteobacteria bacterium]|nr:CoA ester lyase [Pseudomonadota bacterium]
MIHRSLLFVPGARPERFEKALAAGADVTCIDLEDGTPPQSKDEARAATAAFVAERPAAVRINGVGTPWFEADVEALKGIAGLTLIMLPKAESAEQVALLSEKLGAGHAPLWVVIESTEGLRNAWDIAAAPGLEGVLFGGADYSVDIGSDMEWDALAYARGRLVAACARAGVQLLDVPFLDVRDPDGLIAATRRVRAMGFTGRACIHPDQVRGVHEALTPTPVQVEHANRVVETFEAAQGGPALLNGKLIDLPILRAAERVLDTAKRS